MADGPVDISLLCGLFVLLAGGTFPGLIPTLSAFGP